MDVNGHSRIGWKRRIAFVGIFILLGGCLASSLEQDLAPNETGRLASEFISLCKSSNADRQAYCLGYIEGATHFWKYQTACASSAESDQSFCAGADAARESIREFFEACNDCDFDDLDPSPTRDQRFMERMRKLPGELTTSLGICTPHKDYNDHYCSGYKEETEISIAKLSVMYSDKRSEDARLLGLGDAAGDLFLHLFASKAFYVVRPCIQTAVDTETIRNILLAFVRENLEQEVNTTAILILGKALIYGLCPGATQDGLKPHVEQCITWDHANNTQGARNICEQAVVIEFISKNTLGEERTTERHTISANSVSANPGLSRMPWRFTACPIGYVSSVPLEVENEETVGAGGYGCIRK